MTPQPPFSPAARRTDGVAELLRAHIRRSVRSDLAGVWVRGAWPVGGAVLAPNHHSWWDGYVMAELAWQTARPISVMMTRRQLARFSFLRRVGAIDDGQVRLALRLVRAGHWLVIFPEGAINPPGPPGQLHGGAAWVARRAGAPLVPVALRVVLRGGQWPEVYVRFGSLDSGETSESALRRALQHELGILDAELRDSDPEQPLPGYLRLLGGRRSVQERLALPSRWLGRLTGEG